jgi:DNA (cytosine-5)-methyltransferase 1
VRLLDLFAGAGGCTAGYQAAGFDVVAVDLNTNALKRNPAPTVGADAMEVLRGNHPDIHPDDFDVIHASPPCQAYSITKHAHDVSHPDLVPETLELLRAWQGNRTDRGWIVENVPGAPLPDAVTLCGSMFDLRTWDHYISQDVQLKRHRLFASSHMLMAPGPCRHIKGMRVGGVYGGAWSKNKSLDPTVKRTGGYAPPDDVQRALMGIDWMTRQQLNQAIPPVYTEHLGLQMLDLLRAEAAA